MKKIIIIGAGRSCSENEINEAHMRAIAAAGITIEDLHEFAKRMKDSLSSDAFREAAENFKKVGYTISQFNKEFEKIKLTEKHNINPDYRKYKRARR